jgi:hypothetical protein
MNTSETINEIAGALAKAQAEIQNVVKDAKNPHFKSDYATLDAITDTVRPVFAKHGLAVVQMPSYADGIVTVETLLTHSSGQWIRGATAAPIAKADPQGVGSACTYLRRYSLAAIAALAQTDDDGHAASSQPPARTQPARVAPVGYEDWLMEMEATAEEGSTALQAAWKASPTDKRSHLQTTNNPKWEAIKKRAEARTKVSA